MTAPATALDRLDALERIKIACQGGTSPTIADAEFLATAISDYFENRELSFSAALDIEPQSDRRDPRDAWNARRRKAPIRRAAALIQAVGIERRDILHEKLTRYFDGTWRHERPPTLTSNPHRAGTLKAALWDILKLWPQVPSKSTIWRAVEEEFQDVDYL